MNVAVFNTANTDASIKASGPSLRIISVGLPFIQSKELCDQLDLETRMLPMSKGPKLADGSGCDIHWKAISNACLVDLDSDAAKVQLQLEYESIRDRVTKWNEMRDSIDAEVTKAAQEKVMRPVYQVRAEALLAMLREAMLRDAETARPEASSAAAAPLAAKFVPKLSRDMETVGQTWALIAIMGDADYTKKKSDILDAIGKSYFEFLKSSVGLDDENEAEAKWHADASYDLTPFLLNMVKPMSEAILALKEEPLVSFYDSSDDADALNKKAEALSKTLDLKHADIAIVRMYTWLNLRTVQSHRIEHKTRGDNASASEFFSAMRSSFNK